MIKLNKKFYSKNVLNETKEAFKDVCGCNIVENNGYFELNINPKMDQENLDFEFVNYALSLMK